MQNVVALHPQKTGEHVSDGVIAHVAHVYAARRIGEHLQKKKFFAGGIFLDAEKLFTFPVFLPLFLYSFR
jgi:hypothetical protein